MTTYSGPQFKNYRPTRHKIHEIRQRYFVSLDPSLLKDIDPQFMWVIQVPTSDGGILIRSVRRREQQQK